ncbi:DUF2061 domain-containing protein [Edaphosphingomonas haloaromaticamans]|uniref:DUF2061 domain-containing protein n=1 Tax=Edaphosphingomonas haloaromaticamans TaxID=653954 RepID=A0A1S1HJS1_9SPHN|nr:DUF2061 domain-containing protein [Sphingomonas haloaromaticamans]OHT22082.1 hypothetical protein BHE75_04104 [Sphingomonas haloaromaticamans]
MSHEYLKTLTYLAIHLTVGFSVAYALTGSAHIAGGIALIEPCVNAVAFFLHERAWAGRLRLPRLGRAAAAR